VNDLRIVYFEILDVLFTKKGNTPPCLKVFSFCFLDVVDVVVLGVLMYLTSNFFDSEFHFLDWMSWPLKVAVSPMMIRFDYLSMVDEVDDVCSVAKTNQRASPIDCSTQ
jgi:hypothetical protein